MSRADGAHRGSDKRTGCREAPRTPGGGAGSNGGGDGGGCDLRGSGLLLFSLFLEEFGAGSRLTGKNRAARLNLQGGLLYLPMNPIVKVEVGIEGMLKMIYYETKKEPCLNSESQLHLEHAGP